jgi:hypothetical protein
LPTLQIESAGKSISITMLMLLMGCLLVGAGLARYFRVFVLAPAILLVCIFVVPLALAHGHSVGRIILECVLAATVMPLGYLASALIPKPLRAIPKYTVDIRATEK